jgi:hypothetical protein
MSQVCIEGRFTFLPDEEGKPVAYIDWPTSKQMEPLGELLNHLLVEESVGLPRPFWARAEVRLDIGTNTPLVFS